MRTIKGTHIPRIILAGLALLIFFGTFWAELTGSPIDFTHQAWGGVMVAFLFAGVAMLAASWMFGLETRSEVYITLFMLGIHLSFDLYIFVRVFALDMPLPVPVVQAVVQAYWVAGLFDVVLMYWGANMQQTAPDYIPPQEQVRTLELQLATTQNELRNLERTIEHQKETIEKHKRSIADARRKHIATCEHCGWTKEYDTKAEMERGLATHQGQWCRGVAESNGHKKQAEPA